jgi:hypothetical protein
MGGWIVAFPTTISDITLLLTACQGRSRPYARVSTEDIYFVARDGGTNTQLNVYKATDPTDSFSQASTLAITASGILLGIGTWQDGDNIHIATQDDNQAILYHIFSMSSDSFTTSNEDTLGEGTAVDAEKAITIVLESGGDQGLFYQGAAGSDMGAKQRVSRAWKTGGSWTVDQAVDQAGAVNYHLGGMSIEDGNRCHYYYLSKNGIQQSNERGAQGVAGSLTSRGSTGGAVGVYCIQSPVYYDASGTSRTIAAYMLSFAAYRESLVINDGGPSASHLISEIQLNGEFTIGSLAVDPDELDFWSVFAKQDNDMYTASDHDEEGWAGENEFLDGITLNMVTNNIYERDGDIVMGIVYDDAGTIKYHEKVLRTAGGGNGSPLGTGLLKKKIRPYLLR